MGEVITLQELQDASIDAANLGEAVNGNETGVVTPREGEPYSTLPAAISKIENSGGYITVANLAVLNSIVPEFDHQIARADDTGSEYRWNPSATPSPKWEATGRNYLQDSKDYTDQYLNKISQLNGWFDPSFKTLDMSAK
ncbi:MAG: hypothetical protein RSB22_05110, partial [Acinetobacter sp.]